MFLARWKEEAGETKIGMRMIIIHQRIPSKQVHLLAGVWYERLNSKTMYPIIPRKRKTRTRITLLKTQIPRAWLTKANRKPSDSHNL